MKIKFEVKSGWVSPTGFTQAQGVNAEEAARQLTAALDKMDLAGWTPGPIKYWDGPCGGFGAAQLFNDIGTPLHRSHEVRVKNVETSNCGNAFVSAQLEVSAPLPPASEYAGSKGMYIIPN